MIRTSKGFTIIELMIAMVISLVLVGGSSLAYVSVSSVIDLSKNIENAQEVLRYTSEVFGRSLSQTMVSPVSASPERITVIQDKVGAVACDGTTPIVAPYSEVYRFEQPNLWCNAGNGEVVILRGIDDFSVNINGNLIQITVLPEDFPADDFANGVRIDIALKSKILMEETQ